MGAACGSAWRRARVASHDTPAQLSRQPSNARQRAKECPDYGRDRRGVRILAGSVRPTCVQVRVIHPSVPESPTMPMFRLAALLALSAAAFCASAQGDIDAGKLKAYTCAGCHGVTGYKNIYPHYSVPRIGGQNYDYLVAALTEYKNGNREHPTMEAQAGSFSEQDIADIAAYLASLAPAK